MSKIVIVGITSSGKTCYFYGMLNRMMRGYKGFSIRVAPNDFEPLRTGIKQLGDVRLPLEERFPEPSSKVQTFEMDLLYNLKKLDSFTWIDYPGEYAEKGAEEFINLLEDASCLLICVDGEVLNGTRDDIDDIINEIYTYKGGLEINNALSQAEAKNKDGIPPICVMITKYDAVSEELRDEDVLSEIIGESFPVLFHPGNGSKRIVTLCPVTLGKEINQGGKLSPKNVEKPICFANYLILNGVLNNLNQKVAASIQNNQQAVAAYNEMSFFKKMITPKPEQLTEEQINTVTDVLKSGKEDLDALRSVIETLHLYVNGEQTDWPD